MQLLAQKYLVIKKRTQSIEPPILMRSPIGDTAHSTQLPGITGKTGLTWKSKFNVKINSKNVNDDTGLHFAGENSTKDMADILLMVSQRTLTQNLKNIFFCESNAIIDIDETSLKLQPRIMRTRSLNN